MNVSCPTIHSQRRKDVGMKIAEPENSMSVNQDVRKTLPKRSFGPENDI